MTALFRKVLSLSVARDSADTPYFLLKRLYSTYLSYPYEHIEQAKILALGKWRLWPKVYSALYGTSQRTLSKKTATICDYEIEICEQSENLVNLCFKRSKGKNVVEQCKKNSKVKHFSTHSLLKWKWNMYFKKIIPAEGVYRCTDQYWMLKSVVVCIVQTAY